MTGFSPDNAVSAVIPTRNRAASLTRLLVSLAAQTHAPVETIIVDASDASPDASGLRGRYPSLNIRIITTPPSLCVQRNIGIAGAAGNLILLADDDIEFPPSYIASLLTYLVEHPAEGALSGMLREATDAGLVIRDQAPLQPGRLLWSYVFQTSVWGNAGSLEGHAWAGPLRRFYRRRGNTFSLAGWPLLTDASAPAFRTAVYGLGGAMVRKSWLLAAPFDERLDRSGIGDNYGVALGFPGDRPIVVLTTFTYVHHRSPEQRLPPSRAYVLRVLALDHFMTGSSRFNLVNRLLLRWSLLGSAAAFALTGSIGKAGAALSVLLRLLLGLNPYRRAPARLPRG